MIDLSNSPPLTAATIRMMQLNAKVMRDSAEYISSNEWNAEAREQWAARLRAMADDLLAIADRVDI